jgi:hypothetical protein
VLSSAGKGVLAAALCLAVMPARAKGAESSPNSSADHIESIQQRAWTKRGAFLLEPLASFSFNDPFLIRGGAGARASFWPRSLIGLTAEASYWAQTPSDDARTAQRELRARMRATGSSWVAYGGAEITPADGKLAALGGVLPFELVLRLGVGAASSRDAISSTPAFSMTAGLGVRWFASERFGVDTSVTWRSASITRSIDGALVSARDTAISFEVGVPFKFGGRR